MLKSTVKRALGIAGNAWYLRIWQRALKRCEGKGILIVDIDNTIADTHTYESASPDRVIRISELAPLEAVKTWLLQEAKSRHILYLSARNYWDASKTKIWLRRHGFPLEKESLILVTRAKDKLPFLKRAAGHKAGITYIDDLSYQDASGVLHTYDSVINSVRSLGIHYLDLQFIQQLCGQNSHST